MGGTCDPLFGTPQGSQIHHTECKRLGLHYTTSRKRQLYNLRQSRSLNASKKLKNRAKCVTWANSFEDGVLGRAIYDRIGVAGASDDRVVALAADQRAGERAAEDFVAAGAAVDIV